MFNSTELPFRPCPLRINIIKFKTIFPRLNRTDGLVMLNLTSLKESTLCQILIIIILFTSGLIISVIHGFFYFFLRPFSPFLYEKVNYLLSFSLHSLPVFLCEWWADVQLELFMDSSLPTKFGRESILFLSNHKYEMDIMLFWLFCDKMGVLGSTKFAVKRDLMYIPIIGWSGKFQDWLFLHRNWKQDQGQIQSQLDALASQSNPFLLMVAPEGTRFTEKKRQASMVVARGKGLPELKHHLLPRTKGFQVIANTLQKNPKVNFIIDATSVVPPDQPHSLSLMSLFKGKKIRVNVFLRDIPLKSVPTHDSNLCADWLHKTFQEKDSFSEYCLETGSFDGNPEYGKEYENYKVIRFQRRNHSLVNFVVWASIVLVPLMWWIVNVFKHGSILRFNILFLFCYLVYLSFIKIRDASEIKKGSAYGS